MSLSVDQFHQISFQLDSNKPDWKAIDNITKVGFWSRLRFRVFKDNQPFVMKIVEAANKAFAELEQKGIEIFNETNQDANYRRMAEEYRNRFKPYFRLCSQLERRIKTFKHITPELKKEYQNLEFNLVALRYRLGSQNGGATKLENPDPELLKQLTARVLDWKKKQPFDLEKEQIHPLVVKQLEEAAKYPEWCNLILKKENAEEFGEFLSWAVKDYNPVDVFVLCLNTRRRIKESLLSCILGRLRKPGQEEILAFKEVSTEVEGVRKRILTLPIYHGSFEKFEPEQQERINILNPKKQVTFKQGNYTLSLDEIWEESAQKNKREANFNFSAWGFINFHPVKGYWDTSKQEYVLPIQNKHKWINIVPPADVIKRKDLEKLYGDKLKGRNIFFKVASTMKKSDFSSLDAHGFMQIYVNMGVGPSGEEEWKVLDIGVYAYRFHQDMWDGLKLFGATVKRVLCLMDQNGSYTHRQKAALPRFPTPEESQKVLDRIWKIFEKAGVFQSAGKNCAYPIQRAFEKEVPNSPNFFRIHMWEGKTGISAVDSTLAFLGKCPGIIRRIGLNIFHNVLGSRRWMYTKDKHNKWKWQSLNKYYSKRTKDMDFYNPTQLHRQILEAKKTGQGTFAKGELTWGNTAFK